MDDARAHFTRRIRALFGAFAAQHAPCMEAVLGGSVEVVATVPSTARRGPAPLERDGPISGPIVGAVLEGLPGSPFWAPGLLVRQGVPAGHMHPHRNAFAADPARPGVLGGRRVLLLDDAYVSGARSQSAAAAVRDAGARSVVVAVLGRVVRAHGRAAGASPAAITKGPPDPAAPCGRCRVPQTGATSA